MKYLLKYVLLPGLFLSISCQSDDVAKVYNEGTNEYTNQWMYQQMKKYYYWNENIPGEGNLSINSKEYFAGLLISTDRFSYAVQPSLPDTFAKSMRSTYGFDITFAEYEGIIYGVVIYVLSGSPAYNSGIKRGHLIKAVNGTRLNQENYKELYGNLINNGQGQLQVVQYSAATGFSIPAEVSISQGFSFSQPILHRVIIEGGNKTGYIQIPHFDVGLAQTLLDVFQEFKSQSVNNIVVDLRYNGGGDVSSATALSIILAPTAQPEDLFITFKGNRNGGDISQSFQEALTMNEFQVSFRSLRNVHPAIHKIYILCGSHTASASEIIINNLKPFMDVLTIGDKTIGKDVAGFAIEDDRLAEQQGWILYPSIYKLFNANNEGNYAAGITPDVQMNELQNLEVLPLGNPGEVLLKKALNTISGNGRILNSTNIKILPGSNIYADADPFLQFNPQFH